MGGLGSGRKASGRACVQQAFSFSVAAMVRAAGARLGVESVMRWQDRHGQTLGSLGYRCMANAESRTGHIHLTGSIDDRPISQYIHLEAIRAGFGGVRWFALCPVSGKQCGRLLLDSARTGWVSIKASNRRYAIECLDNLDRAYYRAEKAQGRLNGLSCYVRRPTRLLAEIRANKARLEHQELVLAEARARLSRLKHRLGMDTQIGDEWM